MNVILQVSAKAHEQTEYAVVACRPLPGDAILLNYTAVEYAEYCKVIASKAGEYSVNFEEGNCDEEQIKIVAIVALVPLACQNGESPVIQLKISGLTYDNDATFNPSSAKCARPDTRAPSTHHVLQARITATMDDDDIRDLQPFVASFSSCSSPDGQPIGSTMQCNSLAAEAGWAEDALSIAERQWPATVVTADNVRGGSQVDIAICYELQDSVCSQRDLVRVSDHLCSGPNSAPNLLSFQAQRADNAYAASTRVVFATLEDSDTPYSQVNNNYEISCPPPSKQLALNLLLSEPTATECVPPPFQRATTTGDATVQRNCPVLCYNVSALKTGPQGAALLCDGNCTGDPMRAMFVFRRAAGNNDVNGGAQTFPCHGMVYDKAANKSVLRPPDACSLGTADPDTSLHLLQNKARWGTDCDKACHCEANLRTRPKRNNKHVWVR